MKTDYDLFIESITNTLRKKLLKEDDMAAAAPADPTAIGTDPNAAAPVDPTAMGEDPNAAAPVDPTAMGEDPNAAAPVDPSMGEDPNAAAPADQTAMDGQESTQDGESSTEGDELDDSTLSIIKKLDPKQREYVRRYAMSLLNDSEGGNDEQETSQDSGEMVAENIILKKSQMNKIFESFRDVTDEDEREKQKERKTKGKSKHGKKQASTKSPFNSPINETSVMQPDEKTTSPDDIDINIGDTFTFRNKRTGEEITTPVADNDTKKKIQNFAYGNDQLGNSSNYTSIIDKNSATGNTDNLAENSVVFTKSQIKEMKKNNIDECGISIHIGGCCDDCDDEMDDECCPFDGLSKIDDMIGDAVKSCFAGKCEPNEKDHEPIGKKYSKPFVVDKPEDDEYEIVPDEDKDEEMFEIDF